jgi:hypothetical protein
MTTESKDAIIARLRKILSRTTEAGCTPAEAEAAFAMAGRLMAEHELTMDHVQAHGGTDEEAFTTEQGGDDVARWSSERDWAAWIVQKYFFVNTFRSDRYINGRKVIRQFFFGTPTNIETARWVYRAVLDAFDRLWADYKRATGAGRADRRAYTLGITRGFMDKLKEERRVLDAERALMGRTGTEIVLASADQKRTIAFEQAHKLRRRGASAPITGSRSAMDDGYRAGRDLNLARPVESGAGRARGALPR